MFQYLLLFIVILDRNLFDKLLLRKLFIMTSHTDATTSTHNVNNTQTTTHGHESVYDRDDTYQILVLDSSHPLYLHPSDHPGQILVTTLLNGENFNEWKRSMSLALSAKNKIGIVSGKHEKPVDSSPYLDHWQRCNDTIITWILNSIVPEIRSSFVYITLASEVWSDFNTRFTQINGPRIFELKKSLSSLTQETMSVSAYYTKFKVL